MADDVEWDPDKAAANFKNPMRILVVVYTWRDNRPRLISARHATPREREQYETNQ